MTDGRAVRLIARWEFQRFFKLRELVISVLILMAFATLGGPVVRAIVGERAATRIAVAVSALAPDDALASTLAWLASAAEPLPGWSFEDLAGRDARAELEAGRLDGVVTGAGGGGFELLVTEAPRWGDEFAALLREAALPWRLVAEGLPPERAAPVLAAPTLSVVTVGEPGRAGAGLVAAVVGAMVFAVFTGAGVLFTAITGEKTLRITEAIVSAVSPQAWIDGKVLGTSLFALAYLVASAVGLTVALLLHGLVEGELPTLPSLVTDPAVALVTLIWAGLGLALWFLLFAAIAATIHDPTTSSRGGFIMLPGAMLGLGFLGLVGDVDGWLFRLLALLPLTSPSALPVRMLAGSAAAWEVAVSLLLLVGALAIARQGAGQVFALAIHMTGKEPSLEEIVRWLRRGADAR